MFEGSEHHDKGYFHPLQGAGASLNGSTNADRTNYWEVVPTGALELGLWMESDRMGYLLPALTTHKFTNQREVVLNERRQNYENRPYGLAGMALLAALYHPDHPYHWATIGEVADLHAARLEDVQAFFRRYYHPANASLALAGDIDPDAALALVQAYFGEIPGGEAVSRIEAPASSTRACACSSRIAWSCPACIWWLTPAMFAEGDADLDLASDLLANGKTSRLYRRLVFDERIATDVSASQNSREIGGFLQIAATAAPGHTLGELERAILEELDRLVSDLADAQKVAACRPRRSSCSACRRSAASAAVGPLNAYNVFVGDPALRAGCSVLPCDGSVASAGRHSLSWSGRWPRHSQRRARGRTDLAAASAPRRGSRDGREPFAPARAGAVAPSSVSRDREVNAGERSARVDRRPSAGAGRGVRPARDHGRLRRPGRAGRPRGDHGRHARRRHGSAVCDPGT
jgi:zinc protease